MACFIALIGGLLGPWPATPEAEDRIILTAERPLSNLYRVEVSGWDENKSSFVENSELEWTEDSGKQLTINRGLHEDAVIFLHLFQQMGGDRSHPVAYQVNFVARNSEGQQQFRLKAASARQRKDLLP